MGLLSLVSICLSVYRCLTLLSLSLSVVLPLSYVKIPHTPQESIDALAALLARLLFTIKGLGGYL